MPNEQLLGITIWMYTTRSTTAVARGLTSLYSSSYSGCSMIVEQHAKDSETRSKEMAFPRASIVVIGAGFAGVTIGAKLIESGIRDFVILERARDLGGVWRDNTYPGCACDVPTPLYSLSFAPSSAWSRIYAPQSEILSYIRWVAQRFHLDQHIRYGVEVQTATWNAGSGCWSIESNIGSVEATIVITAVGPFGEPVIPDIPGRGSFAGESFHSAEWKHKYDLAGKRVAVVGTGASAAQFVPEIQPKVGRLMLFQRTPPWVMPRFDAPIGRHQRALLRYVPGCRRLFRAALYMVAESLGLVAFVDRRFRHVFQSVGRAQLWLHVRDQETRKRLLPGYVIGCKRIISSSTYLKAIAAKNVELITEQIEAIRRSSVVTSGGREYKVDALIWGTGFEVPSRRLSIICGSDGRNLVDLYEERPRSYMGTSVAGFPNLFTTMAPYSLAGNQSALFMIENQARYIVDAVRTMRARRIAVCEVRESAQEAFLSEVERRSVGTVWVDGGCRSYYQMQDGRNAGMWPNWSFLFARRTRKFDLSAYKTIPNQG